MVIHKKDQYRFPGSVYIGRGSPYGNPFVIQGKTRIPNTIPVPDRSQAITRYRAWMEGRFDILGWPRPDLTPLRGKVLVCWCKPAACHGDVIEQLLEEA